MTNPCKRYTQPVIQAQPGPEFKMAEVPLFEDPKGKWVKWEDYEQLRCNLSLAEEGVANYALETARRRVLLAQWEKNCTGRHGSQSPCGFTADHELPADRPPAESGEGQ